LEEEIVIKKREILEQLARADMTGADVSIEAIMASGDVCVIVFGAEDHNFGIVKEAGKRLKEFMGISPTDLIGKNINFLIPEPFASAHDGMLRKFIASGQGSFSGKTRQVPAINSEGYLQSIQLTLAKNQVSREAEIVHNPLSLGSYLHPQPLPPHPSTLTRARLTCSQELFDRWPSKQSLPLLA
jgi:PAS domain S-box-containing protein